MFMIFGGEAKKSKYSKMIEKREKILYTRVY
jgi:hypothetical protein